MIGNRTANQTSKFVISLIDDTGTPHEAVSASWELFDDRGNSIVAGVVADYTAAAPTAVFEIDGTSLTLPVGETNAGREIVVFLTTSDGDEIEVRDYFLVVARNPLAVTTNSFVSYPEALALRQEFGQLIGWDGNDQTRHAQALIEAYRRLCRMSFKVPGFVASGKDQKSAVYGLGTDAPWMSSPRVRVSTLTLEQFDALPETFRRALKRAQLAEANVLLGGDPIGDKRKAGIISETIGETSAFFQSKPYLNLPISKQAFEEVRRFVFMRIGIARG